MNTKTYRDQFTADGSASYATTHAFLDNSTLVFVNGVLQRKGTEYNEGGDLQSIIPISGFTTGYLIEVYYLYVDVAEITDTPAIDELFDILNAVLNIKRETPLLLDNKLIAASMSVNRQPDRSCRLGITISGATVALGTISIAGTTDETFSFDSNETVIGTKDYSNISSVTIAGISDGTIEMKAVTKTGQPINQEKVIHTNLPVYFFAVSGRVKMVPAGKEKIVKHKFITLPYKRIEENDIFYAVAGVHGMTCGRVDFVEEIIDLAGVTHHIEADVVPL